jgi:hypothetical protein
MSKTATTTTEVKMFDGFASELDKRVPGSPFVVFSTQPLTRCMYQTDKRNRAKGLSISDIYDLVGDQCVEAYRCVGPQDAGATPAQRKNFKSVWIVSFPTEHITPPRLARVKDPRFVPQIDYEVCFDCKNKEQLPADDITPRRVIGLSKAEHDAHAKRIKDAHTLSYFDLRASLKSLYPNATEYLNKARMMGLDPESLYPENARYLCPLDRRPEHEKNFEEYEANDYTRGLFPLDVTGVTAAQTASTNRPIP